MRTKLIALLVAGLFADAPAWAADDNFVWSGSIGVGGRWVDTEGAQRNGAYGTSATAVAPFTGPRDEAKANEYRDLRNSAIGVIDVMGNNSTGYLKFFGENFGRDDQYLNLRGGSYGMFKGQIYQDKMPHNYSWNALTPLANPGSASQVGPAGTYPQAQNPATWNSFNYGIRRNTVGGNLEVSANSPWFVRADYNEITTTGVRPQSGQLGTGSGNGLIELGIPVDYKTKNATVEGGYAGKTWSVKLSFLDSKFTNSIDTVKWTNFYMANVQDTSLLPPDNELKKWSLNAVARQLPWDSTLQARLTQSKLTDGFDVVASGLKPTGSQSPPTGAGYLVTAPSPGTFSGEHKTTTAAVSLTSTPMTGLDSRIYYNYYKKDNNSTEIDYAAGGLGSAASTCSATPTPANSTTRFCIAALLGGEPFAYKKNEAGVDLGYRIGPRQKLLGGYNYLKVERTLEAATETKDNKFWLEYRNSMAESVSGRLRYQYLQRRSDFDHSFTDSNGSGGVLPTNVAYYFAAYDVSNYNQNKVKATLDWSPMPMVDIGVGATYKKTDYKDLFYGRTGDKATNYDATVSYGNPDSYRITGLGNWGEVKFDQAYHQGTGPLPNGTQTATDFDWGTRNTQTNWLLALLADWTVNEQLTLNGSLSWQKTGGGVDFWSGNTAGAGGFNGGPLVNYVTDNTKMRRYGVKADYKINKSWTATAGYAYEKYDYNDDQMRGYQGYYPYYQNLGSTNNSWLSGAFANPGYKTNVIYLIATYRFN
jgi:hypothetical protein